MLVAQSLVRSYGDFKAVDDVSFTIDDGQIVGLLGHNGAGKTTIMKMLSGYLEADSGTIEFDQNEISSDLQSFQRQLGYLPESLPLYPEMLVADYLDYAFDLKGLPGSDKRAELTRVIQETGIAQKILSPISTLSRGYKQRVGVAQAILGNPKLLILDEPTNGLDPSQTEQMRTLIREVSKKATVILSTHIMQEVDALCERVIILKNGKLALDQNLQELRQSSALKLCTTLPLQEAEEFFKVFQEVQAWQQLEACEPKPPEEAFTYQLTLDSESPRQEVGAKIVSKLIASERDVYQLTPVVRDLESVVREIGAAPAEVSHAA